jgi:hypothetical protein
MRIINRCALGVAAVGLLIAPLSAQEAQVEQEQQVEQAQPAEAQSESGSLAWVKPDEKSFAITTADGRELQFMYDDQTRVSGASEGVEGLATEEGTAVRVEFEARDQVAVATAIEVQASAADEAQPEPQIEAPGEPQPIE